MRRKDLAVCFSIALLASIISLSIAGGIPNQYTKLVFCFVYSGSILCLGIFASAETLPDNIYLWILFVMMAGGNMIINLVPHEDSKMFVVWGFLTVIGRISLMALLIIAHYRLDMVFAFLVAMCSLVYNIVYFESNLIYIDLILFYAAVQVICISVRIYSVPEE